MLRSGCAITLVALAAVHGCADADADELVVPDALTLTIVGPDPTEALSSCVQHDTIGSDLVAILEIQGHDPCDLAVDPATLTASGTCGNTTVGIVRPLGLGYWLPGPGTGAGICVSGLVRTAAVFGSSMDS